MNWPAFAICYAALGSFIYGCALTFMNEDIDGWRFAGWAVFWPFVLAAFLGMFMAAGALSIVATFMQRMKR